MDSQDNEDRWLLCINPDDKGLYYYNPTTGKLSWDFPGTEFVFTPVINMTGDSPESNIRTSNPGFISFCYIFLFYVCLNQYKQ